MTHLSPSLRKAAVLISALDSAAADALLDQMSDEDAAKVRSALVELDEIPAAEQQQALADFLRAQSGGLLPAMATDDGVTLELGTADNGSPVAEAAVPRETVPLPFSTELTSFDFLAHVDSQAIAVVLSRELPQTVAVVVAHLSPEHAANVLQSLPAALATDALERMAWLDSVPDEVQADLVRELRRQLAPHIKIAASGNARLPHLEAVLGAMDYRQRQRVVLELGERNTALLNRLGLNVPAQSQATQNHTVSSMRYRIDSPPAETVESRRTETVNEQPWLAFDDLIQLGDAALAAIVAAADSEIALLALTGAEPRLVARILRKLPWRDAAAVRRKLEHPGPVRLREIEQARVALAAVASRLAHEGTIGLPAKLRFAAAV
jgi:flagellar motor switch protein FliG